MSDLLRARLANVAAKHIEPIFKGSPLVTVLVRFADDAEGKFDVLVTSDTDVGIRQLVERRLNKEQQ